MSLVTSTNIHHVVSVTAESIRFNDFISTQFVFTTADGGTVTVDAFSAEPLLIALRPERDVRNVTVTA
jgi:hypothetical protein